VDVFQKCGICQNSIYFVYQNIKDPLYEEETSKNNGKPENNAHVAVKRNELVSYQSK
jgi:hypothetical protein